MKWYTPEDVRELYAQVYKLRFDAPTEQPLLGYAQVADLLNAAVKEAVGTQREYIAALEDFENSACGKPKLCGHDFPCTCPVDRLKAIRASGVKE